jgi:hypothetical protein
MTVEVDALIAVHRASGAPGVITDIATWGAHDPKAWHYVKVDPATGIRVTLSATPGGTAVDFGGQWGPLSSPSALKVYEAFVPFANAGQLEELYCGQADWCVRGGKFTPWDSIFPFQPWKRKKLRDAHRNHVHVAVRPGVFLVPVPTPPATQPEEEELPRYADQIIYPDGTKTQVFPDGAVKNFGTPFFGSIHDVPPEGKRALQT